MSLEVGKHRETKRGFVLLPRRLCHGARLRMGITLGATGEGLREAAHHFGGLHFVTFACLFLRQATGILGAGL
jgi:hypothetical protein